MSVYTKFTSESSWLIFAGKHRVNCFVKSFNFMSQSKNTWYILTLMIFSPPKLAHSPLLAAEDAESVVCHVVAVIQHWDPLQNLKSVQINHYLMPIYSESTERSRELKFVQTPS